VTQRRRPKTTPGVLLCVLALAGLLLALVGGPIAGVIGGVSASILSAPSGFEQTTAQRAWTWSSLGLSAAVALLIALIATALAWPAAWAIRRDRRFALVAGVGLLMPTYLAYAGWGMLRGPGSLVGDALARAPAWVARWFDLGLAVIGLSLWAWPLAAIVLAIGAVRLPAALLDMLALEPTGPARRTLVLLRLLRAWIAAAVGVVALVMIGSAVPMHLAQLPTAAIRLWTYLSLTSRPETVWLAAAPLLALATLGAILITRRIDRPPGSTDPTAPLNAAREPGRGGAATIAALVVVLLSVAAPLALFFINLRNVSSLAAFWRLNARAVIESLATAFWVGLIAAALCAGIFIVRSCAPPLIARACVWAAAATVALGLVPGVLIGQSVASLTQTLGDAGEGRWPLVLAHATRFACVASIVGLILARQESPDERGVRRLEAGDSLSGFVALRLRPALGVIAAVGCASAVLSIHEIEATVQLARPGPQNLAQTLLNALHYARDEQLCAACINLVALGLVGALLTAAFLGIRWNGSRGGASLQSRGSPTPM